MRVASWNVLADKYMRSGKDGDYSYVAPPLMVQGARLPYILKVIDELQAAGVSLIALQEAEEALLAVIRQTGRWQISWSASAKGSVGQLMLIHPDTLVDPCYDWHDQRAQMVTIGGVKMVNTHIQWAPADKPHHPGVHQTQEILRRLGDIAPAVLLTDSNDRPGGPVRALLAEAGFANTDVEMPTAYVNREMASLDLVAPRGVKAKILETRFHPEAIPNYDCPSDHVPVVADLSW